MTEQSVESDQVARAERAEHAQGRWKRMYESAIKCAENADKTSDHLRTLLAKAEAERDEWRRKAVAASNRADALDRGLRPGVDGLS